MTNISVFGEDKEKQSKKPIKLVRAYSCDTNHRTKALARYSRLFQGNRNIILSNNCNDIY